MSELVALIFSYLIPSISPVQFVKFPSASVQLCGFVLIEDFMAKRIVGMKGSLNHCNTKQPTSTSIHSLYIHQLYGISGFDVLKGNVANTPIVPVWRY